MKVAALISDRSGSFLRAGSADGLSEGSELQIVGKPEKGGKRKVLGSATVLDVKAKLSRIALDDSAKRAKGKRFVALPRPPVTLPVVEPTQEAPTAKPKEAPAIVEVIKPPSAPTLAAVEPAPAPAPALAPIAAIKAAPRRLSGRITVGGTLSRFLLLHNTDANAWTGCTVFIREDGKYPAKYSAGAPIPAGGSREVPLGRFRRDPSARMVAPNMVGITCAEGSVDLPARW